jgi:Domain of unknown function (DUF4395)
MRISRFPSLVDDVTVRVTAGLVLVLGVLALLTGAWWVYAVLAADFVLRAGWGPSVSPLGRLAKAVRPRVTAAPRWTAGPPKRFAAAIGAVLTVAATVLWLAGGSASVVAIGLVMVVFPALEAALGICVGCIVFGWLMRAGLVPESVCVECADITARTRGARASTTTTTTTTTTTA